MSFEEWFGPHVGPNAAVSTYRRAPPQGMTNPPQNPHVRELLVQELEENGVLLKAKPWPPKAPDLKSGISQPSEAPRCRNPAAKLAQDRARKHKNWARDGDTKRLATSVPRPKSCGALPSRAATSGLPSRSHDVMAESLPKLATPASPAGPSPNASPRSPRNSRLRVTQGSSRSGSKTRPTLRGHRRSPTKDPGTKDLPGPGREVYKLRADRDLRNSLRALKTQGRLHRAAVNEKFCFGAESTGGEVIKGAGAMPTCQGVWTSDMSELVKFHNVSVRNIKPSNLALIPVEDKQKKKKKKVDEDELCMSERELYEADQSYRNIRKLRRAFYPDSFEKEKTTRDLIIANVSSLVGSHGLLQR